MTRRSAGRRRRSSARPAPTLGRRPPGPNGHLLVGCGHQDDQRGRISLAGFRYRVGIASAGACVEVVCRGGLVEIVHAGVLVTTHADSDVHRPTPGGAHTRMIGAVGQGRVSGARFVGRGGPLEG